MYFLCVLADSTIINHPVHIVSKDGQISPSSFIPFCELFGNMSAVGVKFDIFNVPVCNSFQAITLNDQLCYEVDLKRFSDKYTTVGQLKSGFTFVMDYNEDRQVNFGKKHSNFASHIIDKDLSKSDEDQHASIYLDTIGNSFLYISLLQV